MQDEGLGSWPRRRARVAAHDVALIHEGRRWTYGELDERVDRLGNALADLGVGAGDRVAYLGPNHPAFIETMFAVTALGALFVPLNSRLAARELSFMIDHAGVDTFLWDGRLEDTARGVVATTSPSRTLVVDAEVEDSVAEHGYEAVLARGSADHLDHPVALDDDAMIMYTSGTTGVPKGVTITHGNIAWNCYNVLIDVDVSHDEITLVSAPLFHTAALNQTFLPTFVKGGTCVLVSAFDPQETLDLIAEHRVTWMFGVPAMFQALTRAPGWDDADFSSIRAVEAGGAPVPEELIRTYQARGLTFMQGYGMTEAAPGVLFLRAKDSLAKIGSAGTPCFFTDVRVTAADGRDQPAGEPGEIRVRGRNIMRGYLNNDEATRAVLSDDGWYRTGDVAVRDEDGYLRIVDRLKDMFISGGENVYPAEVENALHEHEAVADCAVIGVPDERWGEVGQAFVALREGHDLDEEGMRSFLEDRLARYKIPRSLVVVDTLPRSASGKLLKKELDPITDVR